MKNLILVLSLFIAPATVFAQSDATWCPIGRSGGQVINNKSLASGDAEDLTFYVTETNCGRDTSSFTWLIVEIDYTHVTNGNVLLTCLTGQQGSASAARFSPQTCSGSGTCVLNTGGILSKAVTGNAAVAGRLGVRGYRAWKCVASHDNTPVSGDLITINAYLTD